MTLRYTGANDWRRAEPELSSGSHTPGRSYLPEPGMVDAVNIALLLNQPLLLTGEPGTGKTELAFALASELRLTPVLRFDTKSTSTARDLFYTYNAMARFHDAQAGIPGRSPADYITWNALGIAVLEASPDSSTPSFYSSCTRPRRSVVLIDEVDKAPRDFPNDILNEIEHMYFRVPELDNMRIEAHPDFRPIVVITSNSEKQLPSAFLRRCIYYHIRFPERERLLEIIAVRLPEVFEDARPLVDDSVSLFYDLRERSVNLRKKPSTAELLGWISALQSRFTEPDDRLTSDGEFTVNSLSCLLKTADDLAAGRGFAQRWIEERK